MTRAELEKRAREAAERYWRTYHPGIAHEQDVDDLAPLLIRFAELGRDAVADLLASDASKWGHHTTERSLLEVMSVVARRLFQPTPGEGE